MSCQQQDLYEERIALLVGGDLPADTRRHVQEHLATCSSCHSLFRELKASGAGIKALALEDPDTARLAGIRAAVLNDVDRSASGSVWKGPWIWGALAATLAVALGTALVVASLSLDSGEEEGINNGGIEVAASAWPDRSHLAQQAASALSFPAEPPGLVEPVAPSPPSPSAPAPGPPVSLAAETREEPMVVKLVSADEKVVFYWLIEPAEASDSKKNTIEGATT